MTIRGIFYTVAILVSLGTVGAVVSNPQIVQQGAALLGLSNNDINDSESGINDIDMLSQFLKTNESDSKQPNISSDSNPLQSPSSQETTAPPSLKTTPFPVFPTMKLNPATPSADTAPSIVVPSISIPTPTPTHPSTPTPITSDPLNYAATATTNSNSDTTQSDTTTATSAALNQANPSIGLTHSIPLEKNDSLGRASSRSYSHSKSSFDNLPYQSTPSDIPPINIFPLKENPQTSADVLANTEKTNSQPEEMSILEIINNKPNHNEITDKNNVDTFNQWSDPILATNAATNISHVDSAASSDHTKSEISGNELNNNEGIIPIDPNSIFPDTNVNPPSNPVVSNTNSHSSVSSNPLSVLSLPDVSSPLLTPNSSLPTAAIPTPVPTPVPTPTSAPTPNLQHSNEMIINPSVIAEEVSCIGTETVARVGCEVILMCDILPQLRKFGYRVLNENLKSLPPEQRGMVTEEEKNQILAKCIEVNYQEFLKMQIENSLVYNDFLMSMPREQITAYEKRLNDEFDRKDTLAMMKEFGVNGNVELKRFLDEKLGSSLERERMLSTRNKLIQMWVTKSIQDSEIDLTYDELNEYYRQHLEEFTAKERIKWKEMVVLYSKFSNKMEAWNKINWLLNEVRRGVNFEGLAKLNSDGLTAPDGGVRNWTKRGDISSKILENIIFGMPVNQISNIIEAENGFHIVLITEHEKEKVTPFIDAQASIRRKIKLERLQKRQTEYLENLKQKYPVIVLKKDFNLNMAKPISRPLN